MNSESYLFPFCLKTGILRSYFEDYASLVRFKFKADFRVLSKSKSFDFMIEILLLGHLMLIRDLSLAG